MIFKSDPTLAAQLNQDFKCLLYQAEKLLQELPSTWESIRLFYEATSMSSGSDELKNFGEGLERLLVSLDPILTLEDFKALRTTVQTLCSEEKNNQLEQIISVLEKKIAADAILRETFFSYVGQQALNKTQKEQVKEIYKRLRANGSYELKDKEKKLLEVLKKAHDNARSSIQDPAKSIEGLIKKLKCYRTPGSLEKELREIGITDPDSQKLWESNRQKYDQRLSANSQKKKAG
ncbi:unnamed protein product, partial [marine sediment metagenome]